MKKTFYFFVMIWILAIVTCLLATLTGCASSHFTVTEKITAGETNKVTDVKISTLFNGNSDVTKINVSQGMKSKDQGVMVGSVAQEQQGTNTAAIFEAIGRGVVSGLNPLKP